MNEMAYPEGEVDEHRARLAVYRAQLEDAIAECFGYGRDEPAYTADLKLCYRLAGACLVRTSLDVMKALESRAHQAAEAVVDPAADPAEIKI